MSWILQLPEEILNFIMEELLQQFWGNRSHFPGPGLNTSLDLRSVSFTCGALRRLSLPLMSQGASLYLGPPPPFQPTYPQFRRSIDRVDRESDTALSHFDELCSWAGLVNVSAVK